MNKDFRAILFDLDGVLIDSMSGYATAWTRACAALGIEVDEMEIYRREGEKWEKSARDFIKSAGLMTTKARVRELLRRKDEELARLAPPKLFPGAVEVIEAFAGADFSVGVVTGSPREFMEKTLPPKILERLSVSVCGDEIMRGKPNPEPYLSASMRLGIKTAETVVIENAPFGIRSGKSAGAFVVAVRSYLTDEDLAGADRMVDDIRDLPALFELKI